MNKTFMAFIASRLVRCPPGTYLAMKCFDPDHDGEAVWEVGYLDLTFDNGYAWKATYRRTMVHVDVALDDRICVRSCPPHLKTVRLVMEDDQEVEELAGDVDLLLLEGLPVRTSPGG